jgi:putative transposase
MRQLWQADFPSIRRVRRKGIRDLFVLVFPHVESRRVFITPTTLHPNGDWICVQAEVFAKYARKESWGPS